MTTLVISLSQGITDKCLVAEKVRSLSETRNVHRTGRLLEYSAFVITMRCGWISFYISLQSKHKIISVKGPNPFALLFGSTNIAGYRTSALTMHRLTSFLARRTSCSSSVLINNLQRSLGQQHARTKLTLSHVRGDESVPLIEQPIGQFFDKQVRFVITLLSHVSVVSQTLILLSYAFGSPLLEQLTLIS